MRLLLDENLSRHLIGQLREVFPDSEHVTALDLAAATDREIWEYAREHGFTVISKDSDFRQLAFLHGPPPKVVWLRVGNASTASILRVIIEHAEAIEAFGRSEDESLLVVPTLRST